MTTDWVPGVVLLTSGAQGGSQDKSYPPRLVLHTTEGGGTVESLANFYKSSTYWPHFTADIVNRRLAQHLPLSVAGRALSHQTSTQTNGANCIQVEIIGRASESPTWTAEQVKWLGGVLGPVFDILGIKRVAPVFVAGGAGQGAAQRMTDAAWRAFSGVCGHEHVPQNDHYDPGKFDVATFLAATGGTPPPPPTPLPKPVTTTFDEATMRQTDTTVTLDANGNGYFDLPGCVNIDVHSWGVIGIPDPSVSGYRPIPKVAFTLGPNKVARFVLEDGGASQVVTTRVVHG